MIGQRQWMELQNKYVVLADLLRIFAVNLIVDLYPTVGKNMCSEWHEAIIIFDWQVLSHMMIRNRHFKFFIFLNKEGKMRKVYIPQWPFMENFPLFFQI